MRIYRWSMNIDKHSLFVGLSDKPVPSGHVIYEYSSFFFFFVILYCVLFIILFCFCYQSQFIIIQQLLWFNNSTNNFSFFQTKMTSLSTNTEWFPENSQTIKCSSSCSLIYAVETIVKNLSNPIVSCCKCRNYFQTKRHVPFLTWLLNERAKNLSYILSSYLIFVSISI